MARREFPEAPIVAVGAIVLDGDRVLLIRRGQEPLKGEWSIPGGALELGETLDSGVCREVAEETGLQVRVGGLVEVLDRIVVEDSPGTGAAWNSTWKKTTATRDNQSSGSRVRYHYVLVDFWCVPIGGSLGCGSDALEARWVSLNELADYRLALPTLAVIEKASGMARSGAGGGAG